MSPHIVEDRRQLQQLAHGRDRPLLPDVLVPHDCLHHALCLRLLRPVLEEQVVGEHASVELETHVRAMDVGGGSADVVQEAAEEVGFCREGPAGEVLEDRLAIVEDA